MSALPPKADMCGAAKDVRFGPKADSPAPRLLSLSRSDNKLLQRVAGADHKIFWLVLRDSFQTKCWGRLAAPI
jgi:hypothetical protein